MLFCKKTFQCTHGVHEPLPKWMCDDCKSLRNLFYKALTQYILDLCAKRRKLKNKKNNKDRDGMAQYRAVSQEIKKRAKENWIVPTH